MHTPAPLPQSAFDEEDSNTSANPTLRRGAQRAAEPPQHPARQPRHRADHGLRRPRRSPAAAATTTARRRPRRPRRCSASPPSPRRWPTPPPCPPATPPTTVFATGDPLFAGVAAFKNDGTDTGYDRRSGDCHDGMEYFGLSATGLPDATNNDRALLGINHEYITPQFLHASRPVGAPAPGQRNRHRGRLPRRGHRRIRQDAQASSPTCRARPSTAASPG